MGILEQELTAYDVLYKVMKKYSGFCAATEWPYVESETNERVRAGEGFKLLWDVIIRNLTNLTISTNPSPVLTGDLTITLIETPETVKSKIQQLKSYNFLHGYYLLIVINFEESLEVRWFESKAEAAKKRKWLYDNVEFLFFCKIIKV